jgi:hypothetical protein
MVKATAPLALVTLLASFVILAMVGSVQAASCPPANCQVTVSSNVPSSDGTIWVQIDNGTGSYCGSNVCTVALPQNSPPTFNFPYNTTHTITVLSSNLTFTGSSTGGHYVWKEWANYYGTISPGTTVWTTNPTVRVCPGNQCVPNGVIFNYTGTAGLTAIFDKQYKYTMSFSDAVGNPLSIAPSNVTLQPQSGSSITVTNYSQFLSSNIYTITSAYWEGTSVTTVGTKTLDLSNGPAILVVPLTVYPTTVHVVDSNSNPVSGASVTITFLNNTSSSLVSNSNGNVVLGDVAQGTYSATVRYQNQQYGPYTLTSVGNPTNTVQVNSGTAPPNTTTTAIALLAIFGIAFFLILLAIKVRKPAAPPQI